MMQLMLKVASGIAAALAALPIAAAVSAEDRATPCTIDNAEPATIAELHANPDLRFKCVSVEGILRGNTLFVDRDALALPVEPTTKSDQEDSDVQEEIPNRIKLERSRMPRGNGAMRVRVIGVANHCGSIYSEARERRDEEGRPVIVFLGGTCHYHSEAYVAPTALVFLNFDPVAPFTREELDTQPLSGAALRLVEVSPDDVPDKFDLRVGPAMLRAIAERDESAFHLLRSFSQRPGDFVVMDDLSVVGEWRGARSPWRDDQNWANALHARRSVQSIDYASDPQKLFTLPASGDHEAGLVIACWCKTDDCSDKWPALLDEAGAEGRQPYFCLWLQSERSGGRQQTYATLPKTDG